jgi:GTP-sensing pleiotropic transcriptional regulator CodY
MVNNVTNINKTKESVHGDGQQCYHYQQNKRKCTRWWSTMLPISTKQKKVYTVMVNNVTNINKTKESVHGDGQQCYQYQQNKTKYTRWWSTMLPISTKQKKVYTVMVNNVTNINKTKESVHGDGQQCYHYQQNKRKFTQWWSTMLPISTKQKKVHTVMVNNVTNINKTSNPAHLNVLSKKGGNDIWHWKYRSWLETGTKMWRV